MDTRIALGCLRRLAVSDYGRKSIIESEGLEIVYELLCAYRHEEQHQNSSDKSDSVSVSAKRTCIIERALSIMSALSLRNKQVVSRMFLEGYFTTFIEVMHSYVHNPSIARQCCMLVRNCAVQEQNYQVCQSNQN